MASGMTIGILVDVLFHSGGGAAAQAVPKAFMRVKVTSILQYRLNFLAILH